MTDILTIFAIIPIFAAVSILGLWAFFGALSLIGWVVGSFIPGRGKS